LRLFFLLVLSVFVCLESLGRLACLVLQDYRANLLVLLVLGYPDHLENLAHLVSLVVLLDLLLLLLL
jgi:hypothetical protein